MEVSQRSQVGDAGLAHRGGDGLDGGAEGVEEVGELPGALRPAALLQDEPGQGLHVRVEHASVGHLEDLKRSG